MDMAELIPTLPLETGCPPFPLRQYGGYWLPEWVLPGLDAVHARFEARPSDVLLASFPKSGTTWLKALAFATLNRDEHPPNGEHHPLRRSGPHDCVRFLESAFAISGEVGGGGGGDVFAALPSPRLLATHIPYSLLPERITSAADNGCRIVYVCRDPKDAFVSMWLFTMSNKVKGVTTTTDEHHPAAAAAAPSIEQVFDLFCDGRSIVGPQWQHVREYWEESRRRPDKVLFLRYEEMLREPGRNVERLAEFMGRPFTDGEVAAGVVDAIVDLCSIDSLRNVPANRAGVTTDLAVRKESFFRRGVAGDWSNHMSPEMASRLDRVVEDALRGSGFTFGAAVGDSEPWALKMDLPTEATSQRITRSRRSSICSAADGLPTDRKRTPHKVLFLRYEEMTRETTSNLRKLAEFMGCPFSSEEEADGVPDAIVGLCSFDHLRSLEVNRNGVSDLNIKNDSYYRKGVAGDWANYLSPEMAAQLDRLCHRWTVTQHEPPQPMATSANVHGEDKAVVDMAKLVPSLPLETRCPPFPLRQYGGFWLSEGILPALEAIHCTPGSRRGHLTFPKSGTTWLKALAFSLLLEQITSDDSGCRIVCVCRDPKDVLVSGWLFSRKIMDNSAAEASGGNLDHQPPYTMDQALELFCEGRCITGPKGVAGDWRNHMSMEMAAMLDGVVEDELRGSGFTFDGVGDSTRTVIDVNAGN
uniref:Sulfotransferase domain-containing protein n=1 Tax=Oryza glumipatula TaxID=40148 RepID=A0A0E0BJD0_9ORYZ